MRRGKALGLIVTGAEITSADGTVIDLERLRSDGTLAEQGTEDNETAAEAEQAGAGEAEPQQ